MSDGPESTPDESKTTIEVEADEILPITTRGGRETKKHFSLCGISITESGKLAESKMFKFLQLDPEDYGDLMITAEEAVKIHRRLQGVKFGGASAKVPLYCGGKEICPFAQECPFVEIEKIPVGRICPIEKELLAYWVAKYIDEFDVDLDNRSEVSLVTELVELDIYDMRASMILSQAENADMMQDIVVGVDAEGNPIVNEDIHRAFELKERVKRRKDKILEAMVGTRREKYKRDAALKKRSEKDPSQNLSELKSKLDKLREETEALAARESHLSRLETTVDSK